MTDTGAESTPDDTILGFNTASLEPYLAEELGETITGIEMLDGALNVVVAISTAGGEYVLRQPDKLREAAYMNSLRVEYRVMEQLARTAVPAPEPLLYCGDESVLGDPFFLMTALEGTEIPLGSDPPERFRRPPARERLAHDLIDTLAEMHTVALAPFESVCGHQTAQEQVARAADRLSEVTDETGEGFPTLRAVGEWLRANAPDESETTLVHGDYRPGNILFAGDDRPRITGVLDWETATLGDPLTELAYLLLRWRDEGDPAPDLEPIEQRYENETLLQELREDNERGLAPFTARPGSPSRRELVARYEERTGIPYENDRFYRTYAAFSLATVWADLHRHQVAAGEESDYPPQVAYMAELADSVRREEFEL
jgi:aminoglycoside phosphotransferase (APT) family kinase protein